MIAFNLKLFQNASNFNKNFNFESFFVAFKIKIYENLLLYLNKSSTLESSTLIV